MTQRTCSMCGVAKERSDFYAVGAQCKACVRAKVRAYNTEHREERLAKQRARDSSPQGRARKAVMRKADYSRNRERYIREARQWKLDNPERWALNRASERAKRAGVRCTLTADAWLAIWRHHSGCCAYCGETATGLDHMLPMSRGGEHSAENAVPACAACNASKRDRTPLEWFIHGSPLARRAIERAA